MMRVSKEAIGGLGILFFSAVLLSSPPLFAARFRTCWKNLEALGGDSAPAAPVTLTPVVVDARVSHEITKHVPRDIQEAFQTWRSRVELEGLDEVRKLPGYHDEPLSRDRRDQRSVRLNRQWRLFYRLEAGKVIVIEINPHRY